MNSLCLEMNIFKTKFMKNQRTNIETVNVRRQQEEKVHSYVYLGQEITLGKTEQEFVIYHR